MCCLMRRLAGVNWNKQRLFANCRKGLAFFILFAIIKRKRKFHTGQWKTTGPRDRKRNRRRLGELWPDGALEKPVQDTGAEGASAEGKTGCVKLSGKRTEKMDGMVVPSIGFKGAKQCLCSFSFFRRFRR